MDRPSTRAGGQDERVYRCTCGAWAYTGITCSTCTAISHVRDEQAADGIAFGKGYAAALDAAREAVEALRGKQ